MFCLLNKQNLCKNESKARFLVIISGLVGLIGPISQIIIVLSVSTLCDVTGPAEKF